MKDAGTPFLLRANKWNEKRELELKKKAETVKKNEISNCTFRTKISKNSERAIREMRGIFNVKLSKSSPDI